MMLSLMKQMALKLKNENLDDVRFANIDEK
jgi:hypothetical protein